MPLTLLLAVLALGALLGVAADVVVLRRGAMRPLVYSVLVLKAVVALMFVAWWIAVQLRLFGDWADLATLVGIMLVSVALLGVAVVCDVVALVMTRKGSA